eukprot:TRINITY_DN64685_c0_g1_i1.p1 TRINITY_DN64685_c0_g1~~TRINITY_DN64685_c0_g1_i1.p1  ORF type:complete len:251 (+),score=53.77 TRINITY_DN64685_c0_g1_i1:81-755(+)
MARFLVLIAFLGVSVSGITAAETESEPLVKLVNKIVMKHVKDVINPSLSSTIKKLGLDPLVGSVSTDDYKDLSVKDIKGLQKVIFDAVTLKSIDISDTDSVAHFTCDAHVTEPMSATVTMGSNVWTAEATGVSAKEALFEATLDLHQLKVKSVKVKKLNLHYEKLAFSVPGSSFDASFVLQGKDTSKIQEIISEKVGSLAQKGLDSYLPLDLSAKDVEKVFVIP